MASLKLSHIYKVYDNGHKAVNDFNIDIKDKEFIVFVGPSGCGKSTTLRMIAGLEEITTGDLFIGDTLVNDVEPKDRDIAMVFQNYALYPHMTVYENMAFGLRNRKVPEAIINEKVMEAARILDIEDYLERKPKAMSGGQRQRVALGRAIVRKPKVFLMDEPLSNLDAKLRNQMRAEIILLRKRINTTFIYVTHDQTEAMTLGDRIVIMKDGIIMQVGTPVEVFDNPANLFVAEFIGAPKMNCLPTTLIAENGEYYITPYGSKILVDGFKGNILKEKNVGTKDIIFGVRPEHITIVDGPRPNAIKATLLVNEMMGSELHLHVILEDNKEMIVRVPTISLSDEEKQSMVAGKEIYITFDAKVMHFFDKETEESLLV